MDFFKRARRGFGGSIWQTTSSRKEAIVARSWATHVYGQKQKSAHAVQVSCGAQSHFAVNRAIAILRVHKWHSLVNMYRQKPKTSKRIPRGHRNDPPQVRLSKSLSWLLRHGANKKGLEILPDGYVRVSDVVRNGCSNLDVSTDFGHSLPCRRLRKRKLRSHSCKNLWKRTRRGGSTLS